MSVAACCIPVSPLRKEPSHRTEMVSQQLFGERCTIIESTDDHWVKIKCYYDDYEGWCQDAHIVPINDQINPDSRNIYSASLSSPSIYNDQSMLLPIGCDLSLIKEGSIFSKPFMLNGETWDSSSANPDEDSLKKVAFKFLNTGYLWGGKSNFGIDCSGFTQTVFKFFNIRLLRDAYQQASQGEGIGFLQEVKCGDLAFFDNAEGRITHVGILLNPNEIIHASTKVRIDRIDSQGIVNSDTNQRTHNLRIIKRYF